MVPELPHRASQQGATDAPSAPPSSPKAAPHSAADPRTSEIREFDGRVWDLVENLAHPAFLFGVAEVALWCAYETNAAFRAPALGFWARSAIHGAQFLGAWAVLWGTFLRDMAVPIRATTLILWMSIVSFVLAWCWPDRATPDAVDGLRVLLGVHTTMCVAGWIHTGRLWRRAKAEHERRVRDGGSKEGASR